MNKTIRLHATLRELAGAETITVQMGDGTTVRHLIEAIRAVCPPVAEQLINEDGDLSDVVRVYIHGRSAESLDMIVRLDDEVLLVPPMVGG